MLVNFNPNKVDVSLKGGWDSLKQSDKENQPVQVDWHSTNNVHGSAVCKYKFHFNNKQWRLYHITAGECLNRLDSTINLAQLERRLVQWINNTEPTAAYSQQVLMLDVKSQYYHGNF